ncbi:hypothetical protein [Marinobacterium weihaiense]|uniref:Uncharacterized protein n=1 Tax=Marinobacterium weihaiense TaxID=2851016 RepID=A0ABS6MAI6_9GAMM|nr:hypothetical protein [Marinobacterium weihaiense]MBV0933293.1 hypothetical protein [Marinobacterium weihaiense]
MVITGLTPDLARSLDQMIDGKADAHEGLFRKQDINNDTSGNPGTEWATNNTDAYGPETGTADDTTTNLDEDQVITVVAIYKMSQ